jgi:hypothetical protein
LGGSASLFYIGIEVKKNAAKVHRYTAIFLSSGLVAQNSVTQYDYLENQALLAGLNALRQCDLQSKWVKRRL